MTLKKPLLACLVLALILALLAGCGSKNESTPTAEPEAPAQQNEASAPEETAEPAPEAETEAETEPEAEAETEPVHPYAWMGLQDIPKCNYLDIMSTNNYVQVYDTYVYGIKAEVTDACKGLKTYQKNGNNLSYNIEGMIYSINLDSKQYGMVDMTESMEGVKETMDAAIAAGTNTKGRTFQSSGSSAIPLYSEEEGDTAEYEYYEYSIGDSVTERYYMKDGDVFAIYTKTSNLESTNVIKSVSGDVSDDLFVVPDLTDFTKIN